MNALESVCSVSLLAGEKVLDLLCARTATACWARNFLLSPLSFSQATVLSDRGALPDCPVTVAAV